MSIREFKPSKTRISQVSAIHTYNRQSHIHLKHYQDPRKNPRIKKNLLSDDYKIKDKHLPFHHKHTPKLLLGKAIPNYSKNDIFEVGNGKPPKNPKKTIMDNKQRGLRYKNEYHIY
jgi:hypothetical protein